MDKKNRRSEEDLDVWFSKVGSQEVRFFISKKKNVIVVVITDIYYNYYCYC